ncbi:hypothetical protein AKJ64_03140 [candidate division MSBL1 archaeon SCGC-AAA259E17]|uniref:N-acetyltransferase domain-containing protein n=1 Tax=candidate division MSBL1 archaeon SCGC-AAA259E17 TaxID=1698263 RepID=A0A133UE17_9EURY|nr:hypothetical protein AKJ64_03140 [candidate division MSBL1 archaeon SCGC-AAA259E17]
MRKPTQVTTISKNFYRKIISCSKVAMKIERQSTENKHENLVWTDYKSHIIGSATIVDSEQSARLKNINIQNNRRSKGMGSRLLERILEDFGDSEPVAKAFEARLDWYRRHGFELEEKNGRLIKIRRNPD